MQPDFSLRTDTSGIATLTWDRQGQSMNTMTFEGLAAFEEQLRRAFNNAAVRGIIITSAKSSFSGGMDLRAILTAFENKSPEDVQALMRKMHSLFRQIETGFNGVTKPVVCAINGTAMGLGIEIALACHWSIAANHPDAKLGLPEMKVGLFPGGGGTTRMIRRRGLLAAAPILLEGKSFSPEGALKAGLIDAIAAPDALMEEARAWILAATPEHCVKPWDKKGYRLPGGTPYSAAGMQSFIAANAFVAASSSPRLPAPKALLQAAYEGSLVSIDRALEIEATYFAKLLSRPETQAMIRTLFVNKQALDKGAKRPAAAKRAIQSLGVIGAGMMGAAIAGLAAQRGLRVVVIERTPEALAMGEARIRALIEKAAQKGVIPPESAQSAAASLHFSTDLQSLAEVDLVLEATFESLPAKQQLLATLGPLLPPKALIASNTSSLSLTELAKSLPHTERFFGLHFFSPAERMPLLEIISHDNTSDESLAAGFDLARALGKTPIFVKDAPGFYANRLIIPFLHEALRLLSEGVLPAYIENLAKQLGFPVGPLQLIDEVSLDLADAIDAALGRRDATVSAAIAALLAEGRHGRAKGAGFYEYADGQRGMLWEGLSAVFPPASHQPPRPEVEARLMQIQVLEAIRALEDGTIGDIRQADVGAILGWGFAPWSGGPFGWLDQKGAQAALQEAEALAAQFGPRFTPPNLLRAKAASNARFY